MCSSISVRTEPDQQDDAVRNNAVNPENPGNAELGVVPSTSHAEISSSDGAAPGPSSSVDGSENRVSLLLESMDESRPEFIQIRPWGGPGRTKPPGLLKTSKSDSSAQPQESNAAPSGGRSAEVQPSKKIGGLKPGKLVSVNPFGIDVKYLKLSKVFSGAVTKKMPQLP
jgi:hypothetical protein